MLFIEVRRALDGSPVILNIRCIEMVMPGSDYTEVSLSRVLEDGENETVKVAPEDYQRILDALVPAKWRL